MFDLMGAIKQRQRGQTHRLAETAEVAERLQPRAGQLAKVLRETADKSGTGYFSATSRKGPQTVDPLQPWQIKSSQESSADPQNPQKLPGNKRQDPDAVLQELAQTLQANPARLRALVSSDDMEDIANGEHSRAYLLAYFRLMRSDGKQLADDPPSAHQSG